MESSLECGFWGEYYYYAYILDVIFAMHSNCCCLSLKVSGQAYLGIIHPPATGLSFSFANNSNWQASNIVLILLGDIIMILMGVVILNLSKYKQYPMFWFGVSWKHSGGLKRSISNPMQKFTKRWGKTEEEEPSSELADSVAIDIENTKVVSGRLGRQ